MSKQSLGYFVRGGGSIHFYNKIILGKNYTYFLEEGSLETNFWGMSYSAVILQQKTLPSKQDALGV